MTAHGPSRTESRSSSPLVLEAVPGKRKFKRLRKRLSRTRRGYRNDDNIGSVEELDAETETGIAQAEEEGYTIGVTNMDGIDSTTRTMIGKRIRAIREANQKARHSSQLLALEKKKAKEKETVLVETVEELRHAILDQQLSLSDTTIVERVTKTSKEQAESSPLMDHAVRSLIKERYLSRSTPGKRLSTDNSTMAIAIEGGGMRGCVSAGMVAAITALGLSDTIDTIYGSSAGSVVGAYMVSRQMCMDVYVDILPASKKLFVCKKRMITNLGALGLGRMLSSKSSNTNKNQRAYEMNRPSLTSLKERLSNVQPGMNISFVLDGILGDDHGLRPIDIDAFKENNKHQKLRVVSSCVDPHTGKLFTRCFGGEDFFHEDDAWVRADGEREGIFACLQASMTVPGATGPPVDLVRKSSTRSTSSIKEPPMPCFDAFCFEPIPYRSAVEEGATHVIVLASRPEDFIPPTKPTIYESGITPLYFNSHGQPKVAEFFAKGGQQYLYAEDLMLLQQAKQPTKEGVLVPPPEILYGVERTKKISSSIRDREQGWNRAHLFPLRVPKGYKELQVLEQDKDAVLEAVRDGFMTAFDSLSDIVGLEGLKGEDVAKLVFPSDDDDSSLPQTSTSSLTLTPPEEEILRNRLCVPGAPIPDYGTASLIDDDCSNDEPQVGKKPRRRRIYKRIYQRGGGLFGFGSHDNRDTMNHDEEHHHQGEGICLGEDDFSASTLMECLPGFQDGKFGHLAKGLREQQQKQEQEYRS